MILESLPASRRKAFLDHLGTIEDPRNPCRAAFPLREGRLLVVCGTIRDCDDDALIVEWGERHLGFLRSLLPYHLGCRARRWLSILMNQIDPVLSSASYSAFASTARLVIGQDKCLAGALVAIDAIATNPTALALGADRLLAVKATQSTLHGEVESAFQAASRSGSSPSRPRPIGPPSRAASLVGPACPGIETHVRAARAPNSRIAAAGGGMMSNAEGDDSHVVEPSETVVEGVDGGTALVRSSVTFELKRQREGGTCARSSPTSTPRPR